MDKTPIISSWQPSLGRVEALTPLETDSSKAVDRATLAGRAAFATCGQAATQHSIDAGMCYVLARPAMSLHVINKAWRQAGQACNAGRLSSSLCTTGRSYRPLSSSCSGEAERPTLVLVLEVSKVSVDMLVRRGFGRCRCGPSMDACKSDVEVWWPGWRLEVSRWSCWPVMYLPASWWFLPGPAYLAWASVGRGATRVWPAAGQSTSTADRSL